MSIEATSFSSASSQAMRGPQAMGPSDYSQSVNVGTTADAQRFSQALSAYKEQQAQPNQGVSAAGESNSVGARMMNGLSDMASRLKADHKVVSSLVEKATVGGDDALMMKAMMALSDYQQRVQIVSKTVSKAASSLDQLTRLQ